MKWVPNIEELAEMQETFERLDEKKHRLNVGRPIPANALQRIQEDISEK